MSRLWLHRLLAGLLLTFAAHRLCAQGIVLDQFTGITRFTSACANALPPDISGGTGPQGIIEVVNSCAAYFPKTGLANRPPQWAIPIGNSATSLFPASTFVFDPRAHYDRASGRFFLVVLDVNNLAQKSYLHIAVSKTNHPVGLVNTSAPPARVFNPSEWYRYRYDMTRTTGSFSPGSPGGADYPAIGVDGRYFYTTVNYFELAEAGANNRFVPGGVEEAAIFAFDKASLISGTGAAADGSAPPPIAAQTFSPSATDGTIQPAMPLNSSANPADAWFMSLDQDVADTFLDTFYLDFAGGGFLPDDDQTDQDNQYIPDPAPQPSPGPLLDTMGDRMMSAVRDGTTMWGVYTTEHDNEDRSVIRWVKLRPAPGATLIEAQGVLDAGPGRWNYQPAIGINSAGCVCVSWTVSSATMAPAIFYAVTGRFNGPHTQHFGTPQSVLISAQPYRGGGRASDNFARWGDYAVVTTDPVDETFWICHEISNSSTTNDWGSLWAKVSPDPLSIITQQPNATTPQNGTPVFTTKQICSGETVHLNVAATGHQSLRWLREGLPVPGAVSPTLTLTGVTLAQQGSYTVEFSTPCGVKTWSQPLLLDVLIPPVAVMSRPELFVPRGLPSYLEVIPDAALLPEMGPLTYTWNRTGHDTRLGGRVQVFIPNFLQTIAHAQAIEGLWTCTVSGPCGSITVSADVFPGPRITRQPAAPTGAPACGPAIDLALQVRGSRRSAPPHQRPDFGGIYAGNYPFYFQAEEFFYTFRWRHRGVDIVPDSHFQLVDGGTTLRINQPDYVDEGDYDCIITDSGWGDVNPATTVKTWLTLQPTPPWLTVSATGPDPRDDHGLIYDTERKVTVLFGGRAFGYDPRPGQPNYYGNYNANDTWTWNGTVWTKRNPVHRPPPLTGFGLAWDEARNRVVLFGGRRADNVPSNETWEWNGDDWTQVTTATVPGARDRHSMCYDTVRQETLLIGGDIVPAAGDYYAERKKLWAYNGTNWMVRDAGFVGDSSTVPYYGPGFAFDEHRGVAVLFQSFAAPGASGYALPEWNGTAWGFGTAGVQQLDATVNAGAWYDPFRRFVSLAGGSPSSNAWHKAILHYNGGLPFSEIPAVLDDLTGSPLSPLQVRPSGRHEVAYDRDRRALVWLDSPTPYYSGPAFTREIHYSCKPQIAHLPAFVSVQTGQTAELSADAAGLRPLTYRWRKNGVPLSDGGNLIGSATAHLKVLHASAADQAGYSVTVRNAYGAVTSTIVNLVVTGPVLPPLALPAGPAPVDEPSPRGSLVGVDQVITAPGTGTFSLASGALSGLPANAVFTWRHNGRPVPAGPGIAINNTPNSSTLTLNPPDYAHEGDWELYAETVGQPATQQMVHWQRVRVPGDVPFITLLEGGPARRNGQVMAFDSRRGVTVLFGGSAYGRVPGANFDNFFNSNETWEWDGTGWTQRTPPLSPPPLAEAGMAYDARRGRMVLFGGKKYDSPASSAPFTYSAETWEWDGNTWTQAAPQTTPPARTLPSMCYDTVRGEVLMLAGDYVGSGNDTYEVRHVLWTWNGLNWTRRAAKLPERQGNGSHANQLNGQNAFAFDEARGVAVLFGSFSGSGFDYDVFEWDGSLWRSVTPAAPPAGEVLLRDSRNGSAFYDSARRLVGLAGAATYSNEKTLRYWDGARYFSDNSLLVDEISGLTYQPYQFAPRVAASCAFDRSRRALVWFDGPNDNSTLLGRRLTREMHFITAPKILRLPAIHSGVAGGSTTMRGLVAGRPPFTWAWTQAGVPTGDGVANLSYSSTLARSPLALADAGEYRLTVSNSSGSSSIATRLVLDTSLVYAPSPDGAGLWLSWPAGGRLETSSSLTPGSWSLLAEALPPWYLPAVGDHAFFRTVTP